MKLINKKIILAICIALSLSACSPNKTADEYLKSAKSNINTKNNSAAIIELKNALRIDPQSASGRFLLGTMYLEQGAYLNAEKELEWSLSLEYSHEEVVPLLIQVKSALNKPEDVYELLSEYGDLPDEQKIIMLTYAGITALKENDKPKAQAYLDRAASIGENSSYGEIAKAYLSRSNKQFSKGLTVVEKLLLQNPDFSEALLLKGHLLFALQKYQQAAEIFSFYREKHPQAHYIRFFEINSLMQAGEYVKAEEGVDALLALYKNAPLANQYKAQLEYQKQNYTEAKRYAELAVQQGENFVVARMIAGVSAYHLDDMEQAYSYLKPLESELSLSHPLKKMLAVIKMKLGYINEAAETLNQLDDLTALDSKFLQASSLELMKAGDFKTAKTMLEKAQQASPDDAGIIAQKGLLLLSQKDLAGIKSLEQALQLDPSLKEIELTLAMQYLRNNQDQKAQDIATKWLSQKDNKISGYLLQGVIFSKQKQNEKAKESFRAVKALDAQNVAALYNLALFADKDGQYKIALNYYQKVVKIQPSHQGALRRLSQLQVKNNKVGDTVEFLKQLVNDNPDNLNLTLALAQNYRMNQQVKLAIILLENYPQSKLLPVGYWIILGDSYTQLRKFAKASEVYKKAAKNLPKNYLISLRKIGMLEVEKKYPEALQATKIAYKQFPNNTRLEMLLAYFELLNNHKTEAEKQLANLQKKKIDHPFIESVAGQLAMTKKNYTEAVDHFVIVFQKAPNGNNAVNLARALKFNGQKKAAEKTLETYLTKNTKDDRVRMLLAELYSPKEKQKIIVQYSKVAKNQPNNFVVLNNLAWRQYKSEQFKEALTNIEKAYENQPKSLSVLESYGVILIANKKYQQGVDILQGALQQGSKDISAQLALAEGYIAQQNIQQAKNLLNQIQSKAIVDKEIISKLTQLKAQL